MKLLKLNAFDFSNVSDFVENCSRIQLKKSESQDQKWFEYFSSPFIKV